MFNAVIRDLIWRRSGPGSDAFITDDAWREDDSDGRHVPSKDSMFHAGTWYGTYSLPSYHYTSLLKGIEGYWTSKLSYT